MPVVVGWAVPVVGVVVVPNKEPVGVPVNMSLFTDIKYSTSELNSQINV
jgi:hypothetical protein